MNISPRVKHIKVRDACEAFKDASHMVWHRINRAHEVKCNLHEDGITQDIIVELLQYRKKYKIPFDVYVKRGYKESTYGSDMDVYVEVAKGQYIMYALQAKILKHNKRYDLKPKKAQWNKLRLLEAKKGCKAYFLLYNGNPNHTKKEMTGYGAKVYVSQYGCSLTELSTAQYWATRRSAKGQFIKPHFDDFHYDKVCPWHVLTCCKVDTSGLTKYSVKEISALLVDFIPISEFEQIKQLPIYPEEIRDNKIYLANERAQRKPCFTIVINKTYE